MKRSQQQNGHDIAKQEYFCKVSIRTCQKPSTPEYATDWVQSAALIKAKFSDKQLPAVLDYHDNYDYDD